MKRSLLFLVFLVCSCTFLSAAGCDGSGNCYIYASASGSGTGASWANAYTGFGGSAGQINPASMTRGVTYWIAAGSYGAVTFSASDSGTSTVTLEGATTSSHGPDGTWSDAYAGTASFGASAVTTDYWIINGQAWTGSSCTGLSACGVDAAYTIYFHGTSTGGTALRVGPGTNYTISYVDIQGPHTITDWGTNPGSDYSDDGFVTHTNSGAATVNNVYVGYSYLHDVGSDIVGSNEQASGANNNGSGHTYEHDFFARNWYTCTGSSCTHTQAMSECTANLVIRYNTFFDVVEDGIIDVNVPSYCTMSNWYIYGNTIEWDSSVPNIRQALADGFLGLFGETVTGVFEVYNNTFAHVTCASCNLNLSILFVCGTACGSNNSTATFTLYNNLFWESGSSGGSGKAYNFACDSTCTTETPTADYNQGYCPSGGCPNGGGYAGSGAHDLNSNTGNPFVNFDGSSNFNVSLAADTSPGLNITNWSTTPSGCSGNCENIDPFGVTRGANGTIDRGAFQIAGATGGGSVRSGAMTISGAVTGD